MIKVSCHFFAKAKTHCIMLAGTIKTQKIRVSFFSEHPKALKVKIA